ncbi:ESX-1 secretion system protein EccCb1 (plasmid) [Mycobacterium sp. THAF192]|nr:ESX-1 secretion system protein EccCb1 [Mycobacterium sp. THAF192]
MAQSNPSTEVGGSPAVFALPTATFSVRDRVLLQLTSEPWDGPRAYQMWLPPLNDPPALDTLLKRYSAEHAHTIMKMPMGVIDEPRKHSQQVWTIHLDGLTANAAIGGKTQTGKSTFLLTMVFSAAATHSPRDLQFYCLDYSNNILLQAEELPHVGGVATGLEEAKVRRTMAELGALLDRRREMFTRHRIVGVDHFRKLRNDPTHEASQDPYGDVVLIIDGWSGFATQEHEPLVEKVIELATSGPAFGIHVVITTTRWAELRTKVRDLLGLKVEFHPASKDDMVLMENRPAARSIPLQPGRAMSTEYLHLMIAAPRLDGQSTMQGIVDTYPQAREVLAQRWAGAPTAPPIKTLPAVLPVEQYLALPPVVSPADDYKKRWALPVGLAEDTMAPAVADLAEYPHLLIFGEAKSGKTSALRAIVKSILARNSEKQVAFIVVDYRGKLLGLIPESYMLPGFYLRNPADLERERNRVARPADPNDIKSVDPGKLLAQFLDQRRPPDTLTPEQLRARSWWEGYDIVLLIDDFHAVTASHSMQNNALTELLPFIASAGDVGLHIIATCAMQAATQATSRGILAAAYGAQSPTLLMSGDKQDFPSGREFSVTKLPKGQALYKTTEGIERIQAPHDPPD